MIDIASVAARAERALINSAELGDCKLAIHERVSTPWSSATFGGSRHRLAISLPAGYLADDWLAEVPVTALNIHGQLLADATVAGVTRSDDKIRATIELLFVAG